MSRRFLYSCTNPPPLDELLSKVYAVHATPILPSEGVMKAGARDISYNTEWKGEEPPCFRPTLHFALGELVREHGGHSWEETPYAVISPLKSLENQVVNLFAHDTFILGDLCLTPEMTLLIPKGTKVPAELQDKVNVKEYSGSLRSAVDKVIKECEGWPVRMNSGDVDICSPAYINNVEINDAEFFKAFFEVHPHVSYGDHCTSQRGNAFRFGLIEQTINMLIKSYGSFSFRFSAQEIKLEYAGILHNLELLESNLAKAKLAQVAYDTFKDKKRKLQCWLDLVELDLVLREELGKSLTGLDSIKSKIMQARYDKDKLIQTVCELKESLSEAPQEDESTYSNINKLCFDFCSSNLDEFIGFVAKNHDQLKGINIHELFANYAVKRWGIIKTEQAKIEGLDQVLKECLEKVDRSKKELDCSFFSSLTGYLNEQSNRVQPILDILNLPCVKDYLSEVFDTAFKEGPNNLTDILKAHPKTRRSFEKQELVLDEEQKKALTILNRLGRSYDPGVSEEDALKSFAVAISRSFYLEYSADSMQQHLKELFEPMNTMRPREVLFPGNKLKFFEILRYNESKTGKKICKQLSLEKEFKEMFPEEESFWQSEKSFMEIYREMKEMKK
ncbi:hypothetical protein HY837_01555 [archaeon]|nr:hypothetical protein [archaeon]